MIGDINQLPIDIPNYNIIHRSLKVDVQKQYVRAFLLELLHGKLLINVEDGRGMTADSICPRCNSSPKTIMHILRDCEEAYTLWDWVINTANNWSKFFSLGLVPRLEWNLSSTDIGQVLWSWMSFFTVSMAALRRDRNSLVFANEPKMGEELWHQIFLSGWRY